MYRGKEIFKPLNTGWVDEHVACVREWVANIFFYRKGGTTIMIDAGYNYDRLAEKMGWLGIDPAGIRHILITHQDTAHGNRKVGIAGASTTGTLALTAAAYFPALTLTIAMTASDFVWQGFAQGDRDGCKEWPIPGESLFSYRGKPLPYMPFCYQHPQYWQVFVAEGKRTGDMMNSRKIFDDSEAAHPLQEEEMIPVERIQGKLLLVGAEDDTLWDAAKYIRRMGKRLSEKPHSCSVEAAVYAHGTHFVFPEGMLKTMLPVGSALFVKWAFPAARKYPKECRETRLDVEKRVCRVLAEWKGEK